MTETDTLNKQTGITNNRNIARVLRLRYYLITLIIALQAGMGAIIMKGMVSSQKHTAHMMDVADKQRMLSEKILLLTYQMDAPHHAAATRTTLAHTLSNWDSQQLSLQQESRSLNIYSTPEDKHLLAGMSDLQHQIDRCAGSILMHASAKSLHMLKQDQAKWYTLINHLMSSYVHDTNLHTINMLRMIWYIFACLTFTLLLGGKLIFHSALTNFEKADKSVHEYAEHTVEQGKILEQQNAELQAQSEELQVQTDALYKSHEQLALTAALLQKCQDAVIGETADGMITHWSKGAENLYNYSAEEVIGQHISILVPPYLADQLEEIDVQILQGKHVEQLETFRQKRDGTLVSVMVSISPIYDDAGKLSGRIAITQDITANKQAEDARRITEARFRAAMEGSMDNFIVMEALRNEAGEIEDFVFVEMNQRSEEFFERSKHEMFGRRVCEEYPITRTSGMLERYREVVLSRQVQQGDLIFEGRQGDMLTYHFQIVPVGDGIAITLRDITDQRWLEDMIQQQIMQVNEARIQLMQQAEDLANANRQLGELATIDGLTGLKNHRAFQEKLQQELEHIKEAKQSLSVVLIDVDHFKQYNDTFGHPAGDDVLRRLGSILQNSVRGSDFVARYGGEEFVLLFPGAGSEQSVVLAERIRGAVAAENWPLREVTISVGIATCDECGSTTSLAMVEQADRALYVSKKAGRNRVTHSNSQEIPLAA